MNCPSCSTENSDDSKFCMTCGSRLADGDPGIAAPVVESSAGDVQGDVVPSKDVSSDNPWLQEGVAAEAVDPTGADDDAPAIRASEPLPPPPTGDAPVVAENQPAPAPDPPDLPPPPSPPHVEAATGTALPPPPVSVEDTLPPPPVSVGEDGSETPLAPGPTSSPNLPPPPTSAGAWSAPPAPDPLPTSLLDEADRAPGADPVAVAPGDPHGMGGHLARLTHASRPHADIPALIASALLAEGERVAVVVPGLVEDVVGVAVVTDRRVLVVNGRQWRPFVADFPIETGLVVDGWQDETTAMLTFVAGTTVRITAIVDKPLAFEAARIVREQVTASAT